jgi:gamma-glutamyl:cysteine ligase YbdK (ATP-grasp superfamily)
MRHGLHGTFIEPYHQRRLPLMEAVFSLLKQLTPSIQDLALKPYIQGIMNIVTQGTTSQKMMALYYQDHSLEEIVKFLYESFWSEIGP